MCEYYDLEYLHLEREDEDDESDGGDYRFTKSFALDELSGRGALDFYHKYGLIIIRNELTKNECQKIKRDMWDLLEETNPSIISRKDPSTWDRGLGPFGMPRNDKAIFRPALLELRQHPNIYQAFSTVLQNPDIVCSHDRWLLHRKVYNEAAAPDDRVRRNLHLDLNPWEYVENNPGVYNRLEQLRYGDDRDFVAENNDVAVGMGGCCQGIVNLNDNVVVADDNSGDQCCPGGTLVVPGSHLKLQEWVENGEVLDSKQRVVGPMQYRIPTEDMNLLQPQLVALRQGSLLIFDQRLLHGSTPNTSHTTNRMAIPIRFYASKVLLDDKNNNKNKRGTARAAAIERHLEKSGFEPSPLGRKVFGLDLGRK